MNDDRFNRDLSLKSPAEILQSRIRRGLCTTCGTLPGGGAAFAGISAGVGYADGASPVQCYDVRRSKFNPLVERRRPRTEDGTVYRGVCLRCHPDLDPGLAERRKMREERFRARREEEEELERGDSLPSLAWSSTGASSATSSSSTGGGSSSVAAAPPEHSPWPPVDVDLGPHAFATHDDVREAGPARAPSRLRPAARRCVRGASAAVRVVPAGGCAMGPSSSSSSSSEVRIEESFVLRDWRSCSAAEGPRRAYRLVEGKVRRREGDGSVVYTCLVLERDEFYAYDDDDDEDATADAGGVVPPVFREPIEGRHELVNVRKIRMNRAETIGERGGGGGGGGRRRDDGRTAAAAAAPLSSKAPPVITYDCETLYDNRHVVGCYEVLEDDRYLYIVTPYADGGGALSSSPAGRSSGGSCRERTTERNARRAFRDVLLGLHHLQSHGIYHGNLGPEGLVPTDAGDDGDADGEEAGGDASRRLRRRGSRRCMIGPLGPSSRRVATLDDGRRLLMPPGEVGWRDDDGVVVVDEDDSGRSHRCSVGAGAVGPSSPYLCPEVYAGAADVDGFAADLWSAACTLYTLLTGMRLYGLPHVVDLTYRFYVRCGGLSNAPANDDTIGQLQSLSAADRDGVAGLADKRSLSERGRKHRNLSWKAVDLLEQMLRPDPADRLTLVQVMFHPWVMEADT